MRLRSPLAYASLRALTLARRQRRRFQCTASSFDCLNTHPRADALSRSDAFSLASLFPSSLARDPFAICNPASRFALVRNLMPWSIPRLTARLAPSLMFRRCAVALRDGVPLACFACVNGILLVLPGTAPPRYAAAALRRQRQSSSAMVSLWPAALA